MSTTTNGRAAGRATAESSYSPGLEGVIAGESALCQVDEGAAGLRYRGYAIGDLAQWSSFEEVAYLLLYGRLPSRKELEDFSAIVAGHRDLPEPVERVLEGVRASMHPMDVLRTGISCLGLSDPDAQDGSHEANLRKSVRLLAQVPLLIAGAYRRGRNAPGSAGPGQRVRAEPAAPADGPSGGRPGRCDGAGAERLADFVRGT